MSGTHAARHERGILGKMDRTQRLNLETTSKATSSKLASSEPKSSTEGKLGKCCLVSQEKTPETKMTEILKRREVRVPGAGNSRKILKVKKGQDGPHVMELIIINIIIGKI